MNPMLKRLLIAAPIFGGAALLTVCTHTRPAHRAPAADPDRTSWIEPVEVAVRPTSPAAHLGDGLADAFAPGAALLSGFAPFEADAERRVGDAALYGFRLRDGGRDAVRFFLIEALETAPPAAGAARPESRPQRAQHSRLFREDGAAPRDAGEPWVTLRLRSFEADGALFAENGVTAPFDALRGGFLAAAEIVAAAPEAARRMGVDVDRVRRADGKRREVRLRPAPEATAEAAAALCDFGVGLFSWVDVFREAPALRDLRERSGDAVVDQPSALTALFSGIDASLVLDGASFVRDERPAPEGPEAAGARFSASLLLNGDRACDVSFVAVPAAPPYHLFGGVIAFDARHPKHPDRTLSLRLLATRRGAAPVDPAR
ncbi:MAG TPA: hypothetical protein VEI02_03045 [Planctomycetota bacterium]|nr:hypothetical protein [Planctomycetota bacterium]